MEGGNVRGVKCIKIVMKTREGRHGGSDEESRKRTDFECRQFHLSQIHIQARDRGRHPEDAIATIKELGGEEEEIVCTSYEGQTANGRRSVLLQIHSPSGSQGSRTRGGEGSSLHKKNGQNKVKE